MGNGQIDVEGGGLVGAAGFPSNGTEGCYSTAGAGFIPPPSRKAVQSQGGGSTIMPTFSLKYDVRESVPTIARFCLSNHPFRIAPCL